ncbi:hypothetical protein IKQ26_03780 [bacterium]|nr:hypothetical protein [bacterium]
MDEVKMVSLDTSTTKTGYAVFLNGKVARAGILKRGDEADYKTMLTSLWKFLESEKPQIIVTELTVVPRNAKTQRRLTEVLAVAALWCSLNDAYYEELTPTKWRKLVGDRTGDKAPKGRAAVKKWSVDTVKNVYDKTVTDDMADAILLGCAYCFMAS